MRPAPGVFPFIDTVRLLAAKHGLDVEINEEWLPGYGADVLVKGRSAEVSVSLALLAQPAPVQEFAAAHEIAHVVLRHMFWRRILPAAAWAVTLAVLVFVGLWLAVHHLTAPADPLVLVLGGLGLLGAGICAWAVLASRSRRYENDADQLARAWGYTLAGSQKRPHTRRELADHQPPLPAVPHASATPQRAGACDTQEQVARTTTTTNLTRPLDPDEPHVDSPGRATVACLGLTWLAAG